MKCGNILREDRALRIVCEYSYDAVVTGGDEIFVVQYLEFPKCVGVRFDLCQIGVVVVSVGVGYVPSWSMAIVAAIPTEKAIELPVPGNATLHSMHKQKYAHPLHEKIPPAVGCRQRLHSYHPPAGAVVLRLCRYPTAGHLVVLCQILFYASSISSFRNTEILFLLL